MTQEDFANIIRLARRAPLANMDEAETAANLLQRFAAFVLDYKPPEKKANGHDGEHDQNGQQSQDAAT